MTLNGERDMYTFTYKIWTLTRLPRVRAFRLISRFAAVRCVPIWPAEIPKSGRKSLFSCADAQQCLLLKTPGSFVPALSEGFFFHPVSGLAEGRRACDIPDASARLCKEDQKVTAGFSDAIKEYKGTNVSEKSSAASGAGSEVGRQAYCWIHHLHSPITIHSHCEVQP